MNTTLSILLSLFLASTAHCNQDPCALINNIAAQTEQYCAPNQTDEQRTQILQSIRSDANCLQSLCAQPIQNNSPAAIAAKTAVIEALHTSYQNIPRTRDNRPLQTTLLRYLRPQLLLTKRQDL